MLAGWIPGLRVAFAHGQMDEVQLENLLHKFIHGEFDVLCTTTIIENGIDMPNVNTMIVNRADRFGLSQLYQLRGRIGRSDRQAWALLMLPADGRVTPEASQRLEALREFSDLGAGFRIAALDLELRGAGALLGASQSGHIEAIGFEMYMRMLDDAVRELSGEPVIESFRTEVQLGLDLTIPESFLGDLNERLILYRRLALVSDVAGVERLGAEFRDRYGELPEKVERRLAATKLRLRAEKLRCESLRLVEGRLAWKFLPSSPLDLQKMGRLLKSRSGAHFAANGVLTIPAPPLPGTLLELVGALLADLGA
jgi:transcription-repair coupling factor (superfamily II helicase)